MARKRYLDEDCLKVLRKIEVHLSGGMDMPTACRPAGISDATYDHWRKQFGSMSRSELIEKKALENDTATDDSNWDEAVIEAKTLTRGSEIGSQ